MQEDPGAASAAQSEATPRVTQQGRSFGRIPFAEQAVRPISFQDRRSLLGEPLQPESERRNTGSRPRITRS